MGPCRAALRPARFFEAEFKPNWNGVLTGEYLCNICEATWDGIEWVDTEINLPGGIVMAYARTTDVSASRSRDEIHDLVVRRGASGFGFAEEGGAAMIQFRIEGRLVRFLLPMPDEGDFKKSQRGRSRTVAQQRNAYEQEIRARWRRLLLVIRSKFEAAETGISTVEAEFLANTVLPDNRLVQEWLDPQIEQAYATGQMPAMIPGGDAPLALPPGR